MVQPFCQIIYSNVKHCGFSQKRYKNCLKTTFFHILASLATNYHIDWNYMLYRISVQKIRFTKPLYISQFLSQVNMLFVAAQNVAAFLPHSLNASRKPPNYTRNFVPSLNTFSVYFAFVNFFLAISHNFAQNILK